MKFKKNIGSIPNQSNLQTTAIKIPGEKENSLSESLQDNKNPRKDQDQEETCKVDYTELYPYDNRKLISKICPENWRNHLYSEIYRDFETTNKLKINRTGKNNDDNFEK